MHSAIPHILPLLWIGRLSIEAQHAVTRFPRMVKNDVHRLGTLRRFKAQYTQAKDVKGISSPTPKVNWAAPQNSVTETTRTASIQDIGRGLDLASAMIRSSTVSSKRKGITPTWNIPSLSGLSGPYPRSTMILPKKSPLFASEFFSCSSLPGTSREYAAQANAGNNFDKAIVLARYDALKISVSFDGHVCQLPLHATSIYTCLRILYHKSGCDYKWLYIQSAIYTAVAIAFRKHLLKF